MTEIPAARARLITGRCGRHACELRLVAYADEGLETILDGWECPGWPADPEVRRLDDEHKQLNEAHPGQWELKPEHVRRRIFEMAGQFRQLHEQCWESWVLIVPDAVLGTGG